MIRVSWTRKSGHMTIDVEGHEPNGEPGSAVICAAVSAIVQTAVAGLEIIATQHPDAVTMQGVDIRHAPPEPAGT